MKRMPKYFNESYKVSDPSYLAFELTNETNYEVEGNNQIIDGNNACCHLLHIHNSNVVIKNLTFRKGNTEVIRVLKRNQILFAKPKGSIFQIIDGGAVLITGYSNVTFENCKFIDNIALMCGGAISNQSTGKIIIKNCLFEGNKAGHTGSAIDNLTRNCDLVIENCTFINNQSNTWNNYDGPHGQVTIFPQTKASIVRSSFKEGSLPLDYKNRQDLILNKNIYSGYGNWNEETKIQRIKPFNHFFTIISKLYWLPIKTQFDVYYRINK